MNWLRRLFRTPNPTPVAVLAVNEDVQFYEDMRYLESLADLIMDACRTQSDEPDFAEYTARPLLEMTAIPVAGESPDWPDRAAMLLRYWASEREIRRMVDEIERGAA